MLKPLPSGALHLLIRASLVGVSALAAGCVVQGTVEDSPGGYSSPGYAESGSAGRTSPDDGYVDAGTVEYQASEPPPPLPDYDQPPCPEDGYVWAPGYWGWAGSDYYWVPGTWVQPPQVGVLWTPGYWAFVGGAYRFHRGYWGPHVGFYGGVHYGFGYTGNGFEGGAWRGNHYAYNRAVTNVNVTVIHNTYNTTVVNNVIVNKVSYNGGAGGISTAPTQQQRQWGHEPHVAPTPMQQQHTRQAQQDPSLLAHSNGGRPAIAATPRPAAFNGPGIMGARGAGAPGPGRGFQPDHPPGAQGQPPIESQRIQQQPGTQQYGPARSDDRGPRDFQQSPRFQQPGTSPQPQMAPQRNFQQPATAPQSPTQVQRDVPAQPANQPPGYRPRPDDQGQRNFPQQPRFQPPQRAEQVQQQQRQQQQPQRGQPQPGAQPSPPAVQVRPANHAERPDQRPAHVQDPHRDADRDHSRHKDDQNH